MSGDGFVTLAEIDEHERRAALCESATLPGEFLRALLRTARVALLPIPGAGDGRHSFGSALAFLRGGERVARAGWNGKGMWLVLVPADKWSGSVGPSCGPNAPATPHRLPWIAMKTADDGLVPWLASQTDILAEDWSVIS